MIGHDNNDPQVELRSIVVQAGFQDYRSCPPGKNPTVMGAEGYEMTCVVTLEMR